MLAFLACNLISQADSIQEGEPPIKPALTANTFPTEMTSSESGFSKIIFCEEVTDDGKPVNPSITFPKGIKKVWAFFEYWGMKSGEPWGRYWEFNGEPYIDSKGESWEEGESGWLAYSIEGDPELGVGEYRLSLFMGSEVVQTGYFRVVEVNEGEYTPTSTPHSSGNVSVDRIRVDYTYTSELITPIYHLYGSFLDDFVVVNLANDNPKPVKIVVESEIIGYTSKSINTVVVNPSETIEVRQNPLLLPEAIDLLNTQKPAEFHIRVYYLENGLERLLIDQTANTLVYARRDFPWSIAGFTQQEVYELLAAMVTPQDPEVEALIREAADYHPLGVMSSGYGDVINDEDWSLWDRLEALWRAMDESYHITYISTYVSFAPGDVQRIRLPTEVLEQKSGNCIELVLLYASAVEALNLEPAIVILPGHSFLGVRTDRENDIYYFIETTFIGRTDFSSAVDYGADEFREIETYLDAQEESYGWVAIIEARAKGILPIAWK